MYNVRKATPTFIEVENLTPGETIEQKVKRLIENKEPIKDGAPIIFTERSRGVDPAFNVRTDRWEIAVDAMTRLEKSKKAKKDNVAKTAEQQDAEGKVIKGDFGKAEPTQGKAQ